MAKQLKLTYNDKDYTLEYTRRSILQMEKSGFRIGSIDETPMSSIPALFAGAFIAHHKFEKPEVIDTIFSKMTNKESLFVKLVEMYSDPIVSLVEEPEDNEGNLEWKAEF